MGCQGSKLDESSRNKKDLLQESGSSNNLKNTISERKARKKAEEIDGKHIEIVERKRPKYHTKVDCRVLSKYTIKALIGKGSFSDVLRVEKKTTKEPFAIKILNTNIPSELNQLQLELNVLLNVQHPFIINLEEVIYSKGCTYLVMELATGGELFDRIKTRGHLEEKDSIRILQMVLEGVDYLHVKGITHRDLKPENLLFYHPGNDSKILITDFGFAKSRTPLDVDPLTTWCGTPEYIAPELVSKEPYNNKVDLWAIGVITYVMLSGYLPFAAESPPRLFEKIQQGNYGYSQEVWMDVSDPAKDFIDKLLAVDPDSRYNSSQALKHQWIKSVQPVDKSKHKLASHITRSAKSQGSKRTLKSSPSISQGFHSLLAGPSIDSVPDSFIDKKRLHSEFTTESVSHKSRQRLSGAKRTHWAPRVTPAGAPVTDSNLVLPCTAGNFQNNILSKEKLLEDNCSTMSPSNAEEFPSAAATEDSNSVQSGLPHQYLNIALESDDFPHQQQKGLNSFRLPTTEELLEEMKRTENPLQIEHRFSKFSGPRPIQNIDEDSAEEAQDTLITQLPPSSNIQVSPNIQVPPLVMNHLDKMFSPQHKSDPALARSTSLNSNTIQLQQNASGYVEKVGGWLSLQHKKDSVEGGDLQPTSSSPDYTEKESVHVANETRRSPCKGSGFNDRLISMLQNSNQLPNNNTSTMRSKDTEPAGIPLKPLSHELKPRGLVSSDPGILTSSLSRHAMSPMKKSVLVNSYYRENVL